MEREFFRQMYNKMKTEDIGKETFVLCDILTSSDDDVKSITINTKDNRFSLFLYEDGTFTIADWDWANGNIEY